MENIMRPRFSSHGGGKELWSEWVSEWEWGTLESKGGSEREKKGGATEILFLDVFSGKDLALCVLHCVLFPLAKATKGSIYLSWASSLIEKRLWKASSHHMCQSDMAFPLLTLQSCTECTPTPSPPHWGITPADKRGEKEVVHLFFIFAFLWLRSQYTTWLAGKRTFSVRHEKPTPSMRPFSTFWFL